MFINKDSQSIPYQKQTPIIHHTRAAITLPPRKKPESDVRAMIAKASVITKQ